MKKTILFGFLLCLVFAKSVAQSSCGNRDFEDTTYASWSAFTGDNTAGLLLPMPWVPGLVTAGQNAALNNSASRFTIITQNTLDAMAIDPLTNAPDTQMTTLAPGGGTASVRLGGTTPNYQAEKLSYQFTVSSTDTIFQYQYACVLNDGGHPYDQQPYMLVNFLDQSGTPIPGKCDTIYATDPNVPFIVETADPSIRYRRWTPQSKNLGAFIGQTVTVEFVVSGCSVSGHFGYAYIDASCFGAAIANVWPGDCDYDLQANAADVLTLALTYGTTGTTRASASNSWTAQPSADWAQHVPLGANFKHSDCDGNGIINLDDTLAIVNNYSLVHPYRLSAPAAPPVITAALPQLYLVPAQDTVAPLSDTYVDLYLGTNSLPVGHLYGLSFSLDYTNGLVQPGTVSTDFSGSWLGVKNSSMITLAHDDGAGQNEVGMARFTHTEVNGYGYLGRMKISSENVGSFSTIVFELNNVKLITAYGTLIPVNASGCTIVINPTLPAGISQVETDLHFNLFPNPASQWVNISSSSPAQNIIIRDAVGREVYAEKPNTQQAQIDVSGFAKGVYFITVCSETGISTKQFVIE